MGTGHVMRCLALAQAWQDTGGDVVFAMAETTPAIEQRLARERCEVVGWDASPGGEEDSHRLTDLARARSAQWIVVDGYQFNSEFQYRVKKAGLKLVFVDDTGSCGPYLADFVLNQNPHAESMEYSKREAYTRLLPGSAFALLRREFSPWRGWKREIPTVARKVLVTLGGSDPKNLTSQVVRTLFEFAGELEVTVVVGGSNPHLDSICSTVARFQGSAKLVRDAASMPELLSWADLAIAGAGSVCTEICLLGLPAILIDTVANQTPVAQALDRLGAAVHVSCTPDLQDRLEPAVRQLQTSPEVRSRLSTKSQSLVDGYGAQRVVAAMRGTELKLRPVDSGDCSLLWQWTNESKVRSASFSQEPVPWERHVQWFQSKLADRNAHLLVATDSASAPVGIVRFQVEGTRAIVSISIDENSRGKGYGHAILTKAVREFFQSTAVAVVEAYVRPENEASLRLFGSAGFERDRTSGAEKHSAVHFVLRRKAS